MPRFTRTGKDVLDMLNSQNDSAVVVLIKYIVDHAPSIINAIFLGIYWLHLRRPPESVLSELPKPPDDREPPDGTGITTPTHLV